jgi:hypothetical protein
LLFTLAFAACTGTVTNGETPAPAPSEDPSAAAGGARGDSVSGRGGVERAGGGGGPIAGVAGAPREGGASGAAPPDASALAGDAGARDAHAPVVGGAGGSADVDGPPAGWQPAMVAVGESGVRVLSRTLGATWEAKAILGGGGDDSNLLRAVAYGRGIWVAAGWKLLTSSDGGRTWAEHPQEPRCKLMESIAYANGTFLAACAPDVFRSQDGVTWTRHGSFGAFGSHAYIIAANGQFAGSSDQGTSYVSHDGVTWTPLAGVSRVAFCNGELRSGSACASPAWGYDTFLRASTNGIARSADGKSWTRVLDGVGIYRFGFGYAPAP